MNYASKIKEKIITFDNEIGVLLLALKEINIKRETLAGLIEEDYEDDSEDDSEEDSEDDNEDDREDDFQEEMPEDKNKYQEGSFTYLAREILAKKKVPMRLKKIAAELKMDHGQTKVLGVIIAQEAGKKKCFYRYEDKKGIYGLKVLKHTYAKGLFDK